MVNKVASRKVTHWQARAHVRKDFGILISLGDTRAAFSSDLVAAQSLPASKKQLEAKLDKPCVSGGKNLPKRRVTKVTVRRTEVEMVGHVEKLAAQLKRFLERKYGVDFVGRECEAGKGPHSLPKVLPKQLQRELYFPRAIGAKNLAKGCGYVCKRSVRISEIRVVE